MSDWISNYIAYTDNTEPSTLYREWVAVSVVASALQRKCYIKWGHLTWYPNLYIVLVGPPGAARKSTAMKDGRQFLDKLSIPIAPEAITREALIQDMARCQDTILQPELSKIIVHSSLTVYSSELAVFLGKNRHELLYDLADWFDCTDIWTNKTKTQGVDKIVNVFLNLMGATTPKLIQAILPIAVIGGGLSSRMVYVYSQGIGKPVAFPSLPDNHYEAHDQLLIGLEEIKIRYGGFTYDKAYLGKYIDWYTEHMANPIFKDNQNLQEYGTRRQVFLQKLAMIMSASRDGSMHIDEECFDRALELLERTERVMPYTFEGYGQATHAEVMKEIMSYIRANKKVTWGMLLATFYPNLENGNATLEMIIGVFEKTGFCKRRVDPNKGNDIIELI